MSKTTTPVLSQITPDPDSLGHVFVLYCPLCEVVFRFRVASRFMWQAVEEIKNSSDLTESGQTQHTAFRNFHRNHAHG